MARDRRTRFRIVLHAAALMVLCACGGDSSAGTPGGNVKPPVTPAPAGLAYPENPADYVVARAIVPNVPSSSGGPITSYAVWPPLPAGLTLDRNSGAISGTPAEITAAGDYHVTAVNGSGLSTAAVRITIKAEGTDVAPPKLIELSMTPETVDTATQEQIVRVTARLTDDLSGVSGLFVTFRGPSGTRSLSGSSTRVSGDGLDGIYTATVTVPRYAERGTWHVTSLQLGDRAGNGRSLAEAELVELGLPATFLNTGTATDTASPRVWALSIAPTTIDTTERAQLVTVTARLTDDLAGVDPYSAVGLRSPSGRGLFARAPTRISGDELDGIYTFTFEVPRYAESGTLHLEYLTASDRAGNAAWLEEPELAALGFSTTLVNVGTVIDTAAPQLLELSIAPATIDTRAHAQAVTLTVRLTDDLAGVAGWGLFSLDRPSPSEMITGRLADLVRVWGDGRDGIYTFTIDVPQYAEFGTWHLRSLTFMDDAGNRAFLPEAELVALGFPTTFANGE